MLCIYSLRQMVLAFVHVHLLYVELLMEPPDAINKQCCIKGRAVILLHLMNKLQHSIEESDGTVMHC